MVTLVHICLRVLYDQCYLVNLCNLLHFNFILNENYVKCHCLSDLIILIHF